MRKPKSVVVLVLIMSVFVLISTACLAIGAPTVRTLAAADVSKMKEVLAESIQADEVPPDWVIGIIFQERWQHSYGLNSDPFNNVRIKVFIPNDLITLIPCNPRQEMHFVRDYDPGDIIAFDLPSGRSRVSSEQDQIYICREEIMIIQKGVLGPPVEENPEEIVVP